MWTDAHTHWQFHDLHTRASEWHPIINELGLTCVVNGTHPDDWPLVQSLTQTSPNIIPSYGLHPWRVADAPANWLHTLTTHVQHNGVIGEIGLDLWMKQPQPDLQEYAFLSQWRLAVQLNCPVTVHCLRAWDWLHKCLRPESIPTAGWMLHAFGGDWGQAQTFLDLGAYFSFHPWMMHSRKHFVRDAFRKMPAERILVETDAPAMAPPDPWFQATWNDSNRLIHHPANIVAAHSALAEVRNAPIHTLRERVAANFSQLFSQK